jgi:hypothetical protein
MQTPEKGNLIGFYNLKKEPGDDRPAFQGRLSLPGNPMERPFALWPTTSEKTGETLLSGRAGESARSQIDKLANPEKPLDPDTAIKVAQNEGRGLTIDPHGILLFSNKQKDAEHPDRPDYWGYYNPGGSDRLMKLAVWARTDRGGKAMLTGNVQRDEPRQDKDAEQEKDEDPEPAAVKKSRSTLRNGRDRNEERAR